MRSAFSAFPLPLAALLLFSAAFPASAFADGSPWIAEPRTGSVGVAYMRQRATEFWAGTRKGPTPGGGNELLQGTGWLTASYALHDAVAVDAQVGSARSEFGDAPKLNGRTDVNVGLTWRVVDELTTNMPSVALRGGLIFAGDYELGHINSIGDGGDGYEASVIVGRYFDRLGVSFEYGVRNRKNDIPNNTFTNVTAQLAAHDRLTLGLEYKRVDSEDALDIGAPGFSPARFPEVQEEASVLGGRVFIGLADNVSVSVFYGRTLDGRNTADSNIIGGSLSYSFRRD